MTTKSQQPTKSEKVKGGQTGKRARNKPNKDIILLPKTHMYHYKGYIYNRGGVAYVSMPPSELNPVRVRTSMGVPFEADRGALQKILVQYIEGHFFKESESKEKTVANIYNEFAEIHFNNMTGQLKRRYEYVAITYLKAIEHTAITDIDAIRSHILAEMDKQKIAQGTLRKHTQILRRMFDYAIEQGYMTVNPVTSSMIPAAPKTKIRYFDKAEMKRIYKILIDEYKPETLYLIRFLHITGCRIGEALKLTWNDIQDKYIIIDGKGSRERKFPINNELFPALPGLIERIKKVNGSRAGVFHWKNEQTPQKQFRNILQKMGIYKPGLNVHAIRKTTENEMIYDRKLPSEDVAKLLGHSERVQKEHYKRAIEYDELEEKLLKAHRQNKKR